jgi:peptidylprolyl isomerase
VRKIPAALAILGLTAVALVGCSVSGAPDCTRTVSDDASLDLVTVEGGTDAEPEVEVYTPFRAQAPAYTDLAAGDGEIPITSADQLVVLDLTLFAGSSGERLVGTAYDGDLSQPIPLSQFEQSLPVLEDALTCASAGSRVLVAMSPDDIQDEVAASIGLEADESAIAVVDVRKVYLPAAEGTLQFNSGMGLPAVVRAPDGQPGVVVPDGAAPDDLVVQTLIKGDGPVIEEDSVVRAHVLAVSWDDKEQVNSTWESGAPQSQSVAGQQLLQDVLVGQTVGSQVMAVIPAELGGTDQATVFVFDILGLDAEPAQ